jgi:hypothetical protein
VGKSHGDPLAHEGSRGTAVKGRKGKRGGGSGRNQTSVLPSDADPIATSSDAPVAGADGDCQVAEKDHGELGQATRPRKAGNGRRPNGGAKRERSRGGGKAEESSGAGIQAEAADLARTSAAPEPTATETPAS